MKPFKNSGESSLAKLLTTLGLDWSYESEKLPYVIPSKNKAYTPDFIVELSCGHKIYLEHKHIFRSSDLNKLKYVKQSNPSLDIRLIFPYNKTIRSLQVPKYDRGIKYSDWCDKHGFPYYIGINPPKKWFKK